MRYRTSAGLDLANECDGIDLRLDQKQMRRQSSDSANFRMNLALGSG